MVVLVVETELVRRDVTIADDQAVVPGHEPAEQNVVHDIERRP
jgi:hypothetical protein